MRPYQLCRECVMDTSDSKIVFDDRGICDHCRTYKVKIAPNWANGRLSSEQELRALLQCIREQGRPSDFDCIIGVSGGVDSSYLTYLAKTEFDLRPLVFHVDTGW